jgi:hypothetical protein
MKPAKGVKGCLLRTMDGRAVFRIYKKDFTFTDYDIFNHDISITIDDDDAFFYERDGKMFIDYGPATLGE